MPVVLTDSRAVGRSVYGQVITNFSQMGSLPHFLTPGASLARARYKFGSSHEKFDVWPIGLTVG